ncbi:MAG TPA: hypothetical protein DCO77_07785 [Nitrospiraceae bacterium]|nr:hypothetical protein [Nitrospiraceae bacterium]
MDLDLTYDEAASHVERVIAKGKFAKADVFIANLSGRRFLVKDFSRKGFWERTLIGRVFIGRELRAYAALAGIDGLPSWFKRLNPFALAVEYLAGRDLGGINQGEIGNEVMLQFQRIVDAVHSRGWIHGDLQRRSNVLLVGRKVFVVDLASAFHPRGVPVIGWFLHRFFGFFDRLSFIKLKKIYLPDQLTAGERRLLSLRNFFMSAKW